MSKPKAPRGTYWRGDTLWGRAKVKGQDIRWSLHTADPKVARYQRKAGHDRAIELAHHDGARLLFAELLPGWGRHIRKQVSPATEKRYLCSLEQIAEFLEGRHLDEVNGTLVAEIIADRQLEEVTNATIKRDLVALSSVMNYAVLSGAIEANPVLPRMRLLKERAAAITLPTDADIEKIAGRAPGLFSTVILAAWRTGCRLSELTKAKRPQVDHGRRQLTVHGKGSRVRVIDLDLFGAWEVFRTLPAMIGRASLFWHGSGLPYLNASSRFRALCLDLAKQDPEFKPFRFHALRHRHAIDWLKAGRSIYDLQQRLGHTTVKTTERYLAFLTADEHRVAKQGSMEARIGAQKESGGT